jgi:hypothetical protein
VRYLKKNGDLTGRYFFCYRAMEDQEKEQGDNEHRIRYLFDVEICFGTVLIGALKKDFA